MCLRGIQLWSELLPTPLGVIVTARKFDRERQREYAVTVTATDQAAAPLIGICQLNILILDENDNSPKFENIRYECEYWGRDSLVVLNGSSRCLLVFVCLTCARPCVQASVQGRRHTHASARVRMHARTHTFLFICGGASGNCIYKQLPVDSNAPVVEMPRYIISDKRCFFHSNSILMYTIRCFPPDFLREDTMIGTSFLRVAAHDDDYSSNAAVTYSMSKENPEYLRVNPLTGWVYVNQPISQVRNWTYCRSHTIPELGEFGNFPLVLLSQEA